MSFKYFNGQNYASTGFWIKIGCKIHENVNFNRKIQIFKQYFIKIEDIRQLIN